MITSKNNNLIPIILSGGSGSRLWPLSRKSFPKQFWSLDANSNKTLLQNTILRLRNFKNISGKTGSFQEKFSVYARTNLSCKRYNCDGIIKKTNISNPNPPRAKR